MGIKNRITVDKIFPHKKNGFKEPFFFINYFCIDILFNRNKIYFIWSSLTRCSGEGKKE